MYNLKKLSALAGALVLSFSLASCGKNKKADKASDQGSNTKTSETADSSEKEDKGENKDGKKMLTYLDVGTPPKDLDKVNKELNKYLEKNGADYGVNLRFRDWGDYEQKLQLATNTGEDRDLAFTAVYAGPYASLAEKGAFLDITDMVNKDDKIKEQLTDDVIKGAKINGKLYGVPGAGPGVVAGDYFVWNKGFVDKYKIPYKDVKTLKDLEPYLKEVKEKEPNCKYPLAVANDRGILTSPDPQNVVVNGVSVVEKDGKLVAQNQFKDPAYKEQVDVMRDYMKKGYITPDAPEIEAGQKYSGDSWLVTKAEGGPGSDTIRQQSFGTEVVSYPIGEHVLISNDKVQGKLVAINSQTENKKEAMDFIHRMFTSKDLQRILCYGIEGDHYNMKDGKVERTKNYMNYDVPGFTFISSYTQTPLYGELTKGDKEYDEAMKTFKEKLTPSPILGFTMDREKVNSNILNVEQVYSEYKKNIQTGAFDDNYYDEFLKRLDDAGINDVIKETQKQLDAWNK